MRQITAIAIALLAAGLALTASGPASAGGGCHSDVFTDEASTEVELTKNCFAPSVARIQSGDTVNFANSDAVAHAVTGAAGAWGMTGHIGKGGDQIDPGESVSYKFEESGVFPYYCVFHPSMVGAVVVGDGSAASASRAKDSVKAVSALAPGSEAAGDEPAEIVEEDDGGGVRAVPAVIGVGVLAAITGFSGALLIRRKAAGTE